MTASIAEPPALSHEDRFDDDLVDRHVSSNHSERAPMQREVSVV